MKISDERKKEMEISIHKMWTRAREIGPGVWYLSWEAFHDIDAIFDPDPLDVVGLVGPAVIIYPNLDHYCRMYIHDEDGDIRGFVWIDNMLIECNDELPITAEITKHIEVVFDTEVVTIDYDIDEEKFVVRRR